MAVSVEFDTTVVATGNNAGIVVPDELMNGSVQGVDQASWST